jgi:prepilin signal peptidase PulO-like enzyme (type II secretory pathway)
VVFTLLFCLFGFLIKDYSRPIICNVLWQERSSYPFELLQQGSLFRASLKNTGQINPFFYGGLIACFALSIALAFFKVPYAYIQSPVVILLEISLIISFACLLFWLSWIDLASYFLPNTLILALGVFGLLYSALVPQLRYELLINHAQAVLISGLGLILFQYLVEKFLGEGSLGGGDTKLFIALSAWFGAYSLIFIVMYASLLFIVFTLTFKKLKKRQFIYFPFGPFIAVGAYVVFLCGNPNIF